MLKKIKSNLLTKKKGGKEIIIEVGLAAVGVALLVIYRDNVGTLINTIITGVTGGIKSIFASL